MSPDDDVTAWIAGLRDADTVAAQQLWQHYYPHLVQLASARLPRGVRRPFDEEDVALSAIHSLCQGIAAGRFPDIADRDGLWGLLIVIACRKCRAQIRHETAQKRGGGKTSGESVFGEVGAGIAGQIGSEPTPEFASQMAEEVERLLQLLPDDRTRELAILKMEGYTNPEAAERLECSRTSVERRLRLIRKLWCEASPA